MKSKTLVISLILCLSLLLSGCGSSQNNDVDNPNPTEESTSGSPDTNNDELNASGAFKNISDLADAWSSLYKQNEEAINAYEGMPILELLGPDAFFIGGVQYDMLNAENKEGRFEGELMMAGWPAFIEKAGDTIKFGYDTIREEDGITPNAKAGDRLVETGTFDLAKEYLVSEDFVERAGEKVDRNYYEFKRLSDGSMISVEFDGYLYDSRGEKNPMNDAVYIKANKDSYEFVVAEAKIGTDFQVISFADKGDMTKDQAIVAFEEAGYTIDKTGGVKDGVFFVDKK